jgi:hypothetical protein
LGEIGPADVVKVLMQIWSFIRDFPPSAAEFTTKHESRTCTALRTFPSNMSLEPYVQNIKNVMREHVVRLAPLYGRFFAPTCAPAAPDTTTTTTTTTNDETQSI